MLFCMHHFISHPCFCGHQESCFIAVALILKDRFASFQFVLKCSYGKKKIIQPQIWQDALLKL